MSIDRTEVARISGIMMRVDEIASDISGSMVLIGQIASDMTEVGSCILKDNVSGSNTK